MEKDKIAYEQLMNGIQNYVRQCIENSSSDKTVTGIIQNIDSEDDNEYTVLINGKSYRNIPTMGGSCLVNESVRVLIPQNNYNNMVILKSGDSSGTTTSVSVKVTPIATSGEHIADIEVNGKTSKLYSGIGSGATNYEELLKKPKINNVELIGNKSLYDLGIPTSLNQLTDDTTHRVVTDIEKTSWNNKANRSEIPTKLSELQSDDAHLLVTKEDVNNWNNKAETTDIPNIEISPILTSGKNILDIELNGVTHHIYAPNGGSGGTTDYIDLTNKPSINNVELNGNKTLVELGIATSLAELTDDTTHRVVTDEQIEKWNEITTLQGDINTSGSVLNNIFNQSKNAEYETVYEYGDAGTYYPSLCVSEEDYNRLINNDNPKSITVYSTEITDKFNVTDALIAGDEVISLVVQRQPSTIFYQPTFLFVSDFKKKTTTIKDKIDGLTIPQNLSDLKQDSTHRLVTDSEKNKWNIEKSIDGEDNIEVEQEIKLNDFYDITAISYKIKDNLKPNIVGNYDAEHSYTIGDHCYFENVIYRCKQDCLNIEPTNVEYWESVVLTDEIKSIGASIPKNLSQLNNDIIETESENIDFDSLFE